MAKKAKGLYAKVAHEPVFHKTSIGRNPSLAKMNKSKRKNFKKYRGQGRWQILLNDYPIVMKEKTITIKTNEISQRQYSTLLLELNIMKQQWRSYGVDIQLSAPSLKKIIALGTSNGTEKKSWRTSESLEQNKRSKV